MIRSHNGFTLVELAIALMVIGLLIGGVLKGQELIQNAEITRVVKDINDFETAVMIFRSTYSDELPGDLANASTRLPNCHAEPCNNTTDIGNRKISITSKRHSFWVHLERAGLITDINENGTFVTVSPLNPFGGYYIMSFTSQESPQPVTETARHYYSVFHPGTGVSTRIDARSAKSIDVKMDDGKPLSGNVVLHRNPAAINLDTCFDNDTNEYLNNSALRCQNQILSKSMD